MAKLQANPRLSSHFVELLSCSQAPDGAQFLLIRPLGQPLSAGLASHSAFQLAGMIAIVVHKLAEEHMIHGDLSYGNCIWCGADGLKLLDLHSVRPMNEVRQGCLKYRACHFNTKPLLVKLHGL